MAHPLTITGTDLNKVIAAANEFISDSNAADFDGIPATSYVIIETEGIYGTSYEAAFTTPFTPIAATWAATPS